MDLVIFTGKESEEEWKRKRGQEYERLHGRPEGENDRRRAAPLAEEFRPSHRHARDSDRVRAAVVDFGGFPEGLIRISWAAREGSKGNGSSFVQALGR